MKKYIITAKKPEDVINLTFNTRGVDMSKVKWDWAHISQAEEDARCQCEQDVLDAVGRKDFKSVDDMIMCGEVPVGAMVVVCDGKTPRNGFVCANGNEWILKKLKVRESNAIVYSIFNEKGSAK